jgi:hypothetical protein
VHAEAIQGKWNLDENDPDPEFKASEPLPLSLNAGDTVQASLTAPFEPKELIVDRMYECIDFDRTNNHLSLSSSTKGSSGGLFSAGATRSRQ